MGISYIPVLSQRTFNKVARASVSHSPLKKSQRGVNQLTLNFWQPGKKFKLTFCESWGIQGISTQILQFNLHNISLK